MKFRFPFLFLTLLIVSPYTVYSQLIDNRDLPPDFLRTQPPFEPTDRSQISTKSEKDFLILDNADDIRIQEFDGTDTSEAVLLGNVRVRFDGSFLKAEKLIITMKDSQILNIGAYGNIEFTMNGTKYLSEHMNYQPSMERGVMYNVRSIMDASFGGSSEDKPWFYRAEKVTIQSLNRFVIENVVLSTSDVRFEHYALKVKKIWYLQGKVALVFGLEYMVGQASLVWLPVFLQIENTGNLITSFGNEKRIGYYFINNYFLDTKIGSFDFGFDWYERQGQYVQMKYEAPPTGMLSKFNFETSLANDVRLIKNGDLYSQWVQPQFNAAGDVQRISQFAWYYKLDVGIRTNNVSFEFHTQDLNDPYFLSKYSYRTRFDDSKSINFIELLNPSQNSWYSHSGDVNPSHSSFSRGFNLTAGNFSMTGSWELLRIVRPGQDQPLDSSNNNNPNHGNQFLNNYYAYRVRSLTLPSISYNFGTLDLYDYKYSTQTKITVMRSDGKSNAMYLHQLPKYEKELSSTSNRSIDRKLLLNEDGTIKTNVITNWSKVSITNISTNDYNWFDIKVSANASVKYSAQKTFGTNDSTTTTDTIFLNTNWTTIADVNTHEESGSLDMNIGLFDQLLSLRNGFKFNYKELWSSFGANYTNSQRDSGLKIDYAVGTTLSPSKVLNDDEWYRSSINFESSVNYSYPLYYLLRMQTDFVRESQFTWNNSFKWEWLQWERQPILGLEFNFNWNLKDRVPTIDQQNIINNDPNNIYINNRIYDRVTIGAKTQFLWFKIGTEATIDILETLTNESATAFKPILGSSFTNRFVGGYPKLLLEFAPDSKYHYLPKLTYRYNLFEEARNTVYTNALNQVVPTVLRENKSFNLEFLWDLKIRNYQIPALYPFIYELSELGFVFQYYQDFINIRNSYLRLDFVVGFKFTKYLTFRFSSQMLNNKIYLYYGEVYNGLPILAPGEQSKNFWTDLADGLKIWDQDALKRSSFKLQSLNFELIHDLDTWDMRIIFNLGRRVDDVKQIAFWEPYIGVVFTMKGSNAPTIFPEFQKRFVPAEYQ